MLYTKNSTLNVTAAIGSAAFSHCSDLPSICLDHLKILPYGSMSFDERLYRIDPANYTDSVLHTGRRLIRASEISGSAAGLRSATVPEAVARLDWHTCFGIPAVVRAGLPSRSNLVAGILFKQWKHLKDVRPPAKSRCEIMSILAKRDMYRFGGGIIFPDKLDFVSGYAFL